MRLKFLIICLLLSKFTNGQQITKIFDHTIVEESFSAINETWPQVFSTDNLAIIQNNKYELRRLNANSGNYVFPKIKSQSNFELVMSLEFVKGNYKNQTLGVLLAGQESSNGGILLEVNDAKSFRISKIGTEKMVYTNQENNGWIKQSKIISKTKNIIKIKSFQRNYDFYINDKFVFSMNEIQYAGGNIGIYIGPLTHGYCKSFVLKTEPPQFFDDSKDAISILNEQILILKEENNKKSIEIERLKGMQANDENNIAAIKQLEQRERINLNQINVLQTAIDSLNHDIVGYQLFKNTITNGPDGEAVQILSQKLENYRLRIEELETNNSELKDEIKFLNEVNLMLSNELKKSIENDSLKSVKIQFLLQQIDWMSKKYNQDSTLFKEDVDDGTGYNEPMNNSNIIDFPIRTSPLYDKKYGAIKHQEINII